MPRVKPKLMPRADEEEALRQAAHEFHDEAAAIDPREPYRTEREREIRAAALTRQGFGEDDFTELESSAYTLRGSSSFFRDAAIQTAGAQGYNSMPHPQHGGVDEARAPLATIRPHVERARHERTLSTVATAGGDFALNFTPTAAPGYVGRAFATAVRSKARLAQLLHHEPLPA